jgi:hypothetical protein
VKNLIFGMMIVAGLMMGSVSVSHAADCKLVTQGIHSHFECKEPPKIGGELGKIGEGIKAGGRDFDRTIIQPMLQEIRQRVVPPGIREWWASIENQGRGRLFTLPPQLIRILQPHYKIDLNKVGIAQGINTGDSTNAVTIDSNMYFPRNINFMNDIDGNGKPRDRGDLHWLLHELEHTVQYMVAGGRDQFIYKYITQQFLTAISPNMFTKKGYSIASIHAQTPLERDAENKANRIVMAVQAALHPQPVAQPVVGFCSTRTQCGPIQKGYAHDFNQMCQANNWLYTTFSVYPADIEQRHAQCLQTRERPIQQQPGQVQEQPPGQLQLPPRQGPTRQEHQQQLNHELMNNNTRIGLDNMEDRKREQIQQSDSRIDSLRSRGDNQRNNVLRALDSVDQEKESQGR